jgi:hypothetical protein
MRHAFTVDQLRAVLDYDPETGVFTWKVRQSNAVPAGSRAGTLKPNGRVYINAFGEAHLAHRLAWFYVKGEWPTGAIRQRDGNLADARFANLYEATRTEVNVQRRLGQNNTSGRVGVTFIKRRGKWRAQMKRDWNLITLGYFATFEEACAARTEAEQHLTAAPEEYERHVEHDTMRRRQRVAWNVLREDYAGRVGWRDFGAFCADVGSPPGSRYLVEPLDDTQPVGPDNFDWVPPPSERYDLTTRSGRRIYKRDQHAAQRYGFKNAEEMEAFIVAHGEKCQCCDIKRGEHYVGHDGDKRLAKICVDHDHVTGENRGTLCERCNFGEGSLQSDVRVALRMAVYRLNHLRPGELNTAALAAFDEVSALIAAKRFPLRKESA